MNLFRRSLSPLFLPLAIMGLAAVFLLNRGTAESGKPTADPGKKKIVFIAGKASHGPGEHEHRAGCMLLADHLNRSGLPVEAVVVTNGWPEDESVFQGASAIVMYADGGARHPAMPHLAKLRQMANAGVGIGCIHYGVEIPNGAPGDAFLDLIGGYFATDWSVNPHWDANFKDLPKHPVTRGIDDFQIRDEWYYHMRFREGMEGVTPILSDLPPEQTLKRGDGPHSNNPHVREAVLERKEPQHVMWVFERPASLGGGRGFGFTGGHFHRNWKHDDHRGVVLNAIAWIANLDIPETGVPTQTPTDEQMAANLDEKGRR
ncbi:MAG: ThuA domain-containing protein [Luteolibacter sp.]